ncbi:thiamine phosphate synthase [Oricola thermophila]|uniref:Thiamine phosphate synthase n=1 Tax=Oricola thermophila TaxID=2742145 RepID=A0A6N1VHX6_9HYPH|nr:thiamine phosphate synthase [Oricola thermophila]QKV20408.1 thiamine phosphate synthase [Oricola thermophila]
MTNSITERCRLVLIAPEGATGPDFEKALEAALAAGDVASAIFPAYGMDEASYQRHLESCVPIAQGFGVAAIVVDDTRAFGRTGADGLHVDGGPEDVGNAVEKADGRYIVGAGRAETRHRALELGEQRPDYLFFGRFGQDTRPEPHRRNLAMAEWWAAMVEIPCIVMGGASLDTLERAASTGAEFVALSRAVFGEGIDPAAAIAEANGMLENHKLAADA